ncbi:TolC family protein [Croceibacterium aestuarii]|uniref:TolC family protein n=1 Tax=Croceibacterium aestuarii TaxID=3064139 RepID=UPI00272E8632|nr:TolC family protein [Croceibacterium sp. D39]
MRFGHLAPALLGAALAGSPALADTLDEAVGKSLAHSPELAAARAREDAAAASLDEARAERMPSASAQGQIGTGYIDPRGFFGLPADNVTPRVAQLSLDLPIFTGGRIAAGRLQAEAGVAMAGLASQVTALDLRIAVVRTYSAARDAEDEVLGYRKMDETLGEILRQARLRFEAGEGTSTEVAQAEARRAEGQAGLAAAEGRLRSALARLALLAGQPVDPSEGLPEPPPVPQSAEEAVKLALAANPALGKAKSAADMARAGVKAAKAAELPTVGLYAEGSSVRDQFFPGYAADSASVGLRASWNFFSGGRASARVRKASAEARAAEADAAAAAQQIEGQAVESFATLRSARSQLAAARAREAATEQALRGTRLEVEVGAKPQLALLDAEREAIAARTARISAAGQVLVAAHVLRAIAGLEDRP